LAARGQFKELCVPALLPLVSGDVWGVARPEWGRSLRQFQPLCFLIRPRHRYEIFLRVFGFPWSGSVLGKHVGAFLLRKAGPVGPAVYAADWIFFLVVSVPF